MSVAELPQDTLPPQTDAVLEVSHISKSFAGVQALQDVSLRIGRGEIHTLMGENGSGKSTLIKIIAGVYSPDSGTILINGNPRKHLRPIDSIREGIQIIYQDFSLFPNLTVAENIALNNELARNRQLVRWGDVRRTAQAALARINVSMDLDDTVDSLSVANKQLVAITRALVQGARLIIMDEPTTALTRREIRSLFKIIKGLQQEGISTLFVSHKISEVFEISDNMTVLRNGRHVITAPVSELTPRKVIYHMTGREIEETQYEYQPQIEQVGPLLRVQSLLSPGNFADVSFELYPGEILGITGLLGSGRTELALALFGVQRASSGTVYVRGKQVRIGGIQDAVRHRIGYVPEDRLTEGLFLPQSIGRNIVASVLDKLTASLGMLDQRKTDGEVREWTSGLRIKTPSAELPVQSLSGGNQQRVVLAKWLACEPQILILNGPTVGVDIGSKSEIHDIIRNLARGGMGLIVISDDIPELLHTCSRILLMRKGRIVEELDPHTISEEQLAAKLTEE
jgi:simple sugar transport system ATP-binding protein